MTKANLSVIKTSDDSLCSSSNPLSNIFQEDDTKFETSVSCKHFFFYLNILDDNFKIDKIIVKNNGANFIEIYGVDADHVGSFDEKHTGICILPSASMLKYSETKSRTKLNESFVYDKKLLNRAALVKQDDRNFKGWKKLAIKITQSFGDFSFGLQYLAIESSSNGSKSIGDSDKMVDDCLTPTIIKGSTLDIPFLSDDEDEPMSPKDQLEEARKMSKTKLTMSPALKFSPDLGSLSPITAPANPKKRTLPSGIAAKPTKVKKNDLSDDDSEKSEKETKKTKKTEKKKPASKIKFKALSDDDQESDSSSKPKKKTTAKKTVTKKKPTTRKAKKKTLDDPSDTDDEEEMIDNASDADENGNLSGFVVSNKTLIKDDKKIKDGPVCTNKIEILQGCIIAISGIQNPKRTEIRETALALGAKYRPQYTPDTTHLIAAFVDERNEKSKQAKKAGAFIVNQEWVNDCEKNSRRMNESKYSMVKDELSDEEESIASGSDDDVNYELSSSSSEDLLDGEDREYRPKRKKRKVATERKSTRTRKPVKKEDDENEGNESDRSLGKNSQTDLPSAVIVKKEVRKDSQTKLNSQPIKTEPKIEDKATVPEVKEEAKPTSPETAPVVEEPEEVILSPVDEQEVLRLKEFYDNNGFSKSFADFIIEDVFNLAYQTTREGDIMDYFEKWSLSIASPKFIRLIARSSVDDEHQVIQKLDECKENILRYIDVKLTNTKPKADVNVDGPAKPLPSFFEGCVIYIDKSVKGKQELKRYIIAYGGEVVNDFEARKDDITHILVNSDYEGNIAYNDKVVVDSKWVHHCHKKLRKLSEEAYNADY